MRTELPAERLQRRLRAEPDADAAAGDSGTTSAEDSADDDQNSLLPRWLPDASHDRGWVAKVRADPGRAGAIGLAIVAALAVLVTVFTLVRDRPAPVMSAKLPPVEKVATASPRSSTSPAAEPDDPVVVSVVGLVHTPGLVTLAPGARIADALQAAGGAVNGADTIGLNMARPLGDGEQIVVGLAPAPGQPTALGSSVASGSTPTSKAPPPRPGSVKPKAGEAVNLNTATVQELDALPGVGPVTAAAIVAWRQANGRFTSVDQLADVEGIGPARLEKLRALVRV
ncbi:ComEA family DNA-binding protein [Mycobacterium intracellulare]|uniref:ComEA family DNA-binding protein n=1 Tax=Mycobacterium intracellulare TaxID=1767 RepID=A0AAE4UA51_MYCIT|nr:ComEA family DNA-binding protein [Mycobacterium intracellulare]MCA2319128.1 ComEA family DNA-binding protein [Mycobacterium intracellulare]MCA2342018.1 ComEA family DNA-binding protein [Mycobacterium intracellulare]MDV6977656.1 ComEA family DNA-binding protein [Mycobacterium intracellulare]MDV6983120.1 ComEA family DNA-binding protein [Mycobacterium intracellulare]MDV7013346.1 ComEA family DNA-binding protein [Mycobacterium intracellulare]